jgi:2-alkenal reductase
MSPRLHQPGRLVLTLAVVCLAFMLGASLGLPPTVGYAAPAAQATAAATAAATGNTAPTAIPAAPGNIGDTTLIELYKKVIPSVVTVFVSFPQDVATGNGNAPAPQQTPDPLDPNAPFSRGSGSGFIFSDQGYIVTNAHVVLDVGPKGKIKVTFNDDLTVPAKVVGIDPDSDLAVLKVETSKARLIPLPLADSDQLQIGQRVVAIGNPFSTYPGTMTQGIVSAVNRRFDSQAANYQIPGMVQTDAAINPGNSGGPLLDMTGAVIGINTAIESRVRQSSGVGFAVPSNLIAKFAPRLIKDGKVTHAYLGIRGGDLDSDYSELMGLSPEQQGAIVTEVVRGGPADKAGFQGSTQTKKLDGFDVPIGGDVITAINGQPIRKFEQLLGYLFTKTDPGDTVTITVLRGGQNKDLQVTLTARPAAGN